jgi:hypothetical protein
MSERDVHRNEMNEPYELDDATADALLGGAGSAADPALAALLGDVRRAFASPAPPAGAALAAFLSGGAAVIELPQHRRPSRMRSILAGKVAAATAAVAAATGGLAVAGALPAPVQSVLSGAASSVGLDLPSGSDDGGGTGSDTTVPTTDTTAADATDSTHPDNHGKDVSEVAHDDTLEGCEHGRAVSEVASGEVNDKPCPDGAPGPGATTPNGPHGDADDADDAEDGVDDDDSDDGEDGEDDGEPGSQGHGHGNDGTSHGPSGG